MALDRHVVLVRIRDRFGLVVVIRRLHVDAALFHLQHADVLDLRRAGLVVLLDAGVDALAAADTAAEIQAVDELDAVQRRRIGELRLDLVTLLDFAADAGKDAFLVLGRHLLVVLLKKLVEVRECSPRSGAATARRRRPPQ